MKSSLLTTALVVPGRPIAMMMFKTYGYITMAQALGFIQDLKLGHYMKVPPRTMFKAQVVATVWSCIIQIAVMNWALANIDGICETGQPDHYSCPGGHVFYTASVIWGLIGPARIFSPGAVYQDLMCTWKKPWILILISLETSTLANSKFRVLPHRRGSAHHHLVHVSPIPEKRMEIRHGACYVWRPRCSSTGNSLYLPMLGYCGIHLPTIHSPEVFRLVVTGKQKARPHLCYRENSKIEAQ